MYKVLFLDKEGKRYDFCEFGLCAGEWLTDKLEEVLYIMQELSPIGSFWKQDLVWGGECFFSYHGLETVKVNYDWHGGPIVVQDI
jgi:hypothetical protein